MTFLTGITHGRPDRFRAEVRSVDERVSLTAVVEAISDIMEAHNRGGVVDRALGVAHWRTGPDRSGRGRGHRKNFVRLPTDRNGAPVWARRGPLRLFISRKRGWKR